MLDDPRVDVRVLQAGEPAPHDGVWMNAWTFEALLRSVSDGATKPRSDEGN